MSQRCESTTSSYPRADLFPMDGEVCRAKPEGDDMKQPGGAKDSYTDKRCGKGAKTRDRLRSLGQHPTNSQMKKKMAQKMAKEMGKELVSHGAEAAVPAAGAVAIPLGAAMSLLEGLNEIGKATEEGHRIAETRSYVRGFLNTMLESLEAPHLPARQARKHAMDDGAYKQIVAQFRAYQPGSDPSRFKTIKDKMESYEQGVDQAERMLDRMPKKTRAQLWQKVLAKVVAHNPKYNAWKGSVQQKEAVKEAFLLQVR